MNHLIQCICVKWAYNEVLSWDVPLRIAFIYLIIFFVFVFLFFMRKFFFIFLNKE